MVSGMRVTLTLNRGHDMLLELLLFSLTGSLGTLFVDDIKYFPESPCMSTLDTVNFI
jgi:hypothetical protein